MNYIIFAIAFGIGFLISFICYSISKYFLNHKENLYSVAAFIRTSINVLYIAALFFIGKSTNFNLYFLLIGGALGVTLPNLFFTAKLLNISKAKSAEKEDENKNG